MDGPGRIERYRSGTKDQIHGAARSGGTTLAVDGACRMPMHTLPRLRLLLAAALAVTAASSSAAQTRATGPARDTTDVIGRPGALTAIETGVLNSMKDDNIVAHLIMEDSSVAALSDAVASIAHDSAVANFAKVMAREHAHALELDRALIPGLRGLPRLSPADTADPRTLRMMEARLRGIGPDSALDRTFISAQIVHHVHLLNELAALRAVAMRAPVQQRIDNEMEIVRSHLVHAEALARRKGVPSP